MDIYKVGGVVRDRLLGRTSEDCDWVVVGASPAQLLALGYRQVGQDFPVYLHPQTHEEYALARTERKRGTGYKGFEFDASQAVSLVADLARRDLTINAMAEDTAGLIIDPYGGQRDLAAGVLRHVTAAFVEDPLRVLRVARFAARLGFAVAPETSALMREIVQSGELATLPPERLWRELERALAEDFPWRFIEVLRECGALNAVLPEVDALFAAPQATPPHPAIHYGEHLLRTLKQCVRLSASKAVRYAVLLHDVGKTLTPVGVSLSQQHPAATGAHLVENISLRLRAPQTFRELAVLVARHHLTIHQALALQPDALLDLLEGLDGLRRPARFEDILLACLIDFTAQRDSLDAPYPQARRLRCALAKIRALDIPAIARQHGAGPALKDAIRRARIERLTQAQDDDANPVILD